MRINSERQAFNPDYTQERIIKPHSLKERLKGVFAASFEKKRQKREQDQDQELFSRLERQLFQAEDEGKNYSEIATEMIDQTTNLKELKAVLFTLTELRGEGGTYGQDEQMHFFAQTIERLEMADGKEEVADLLAGLTQDYGLQEKAEKLIVKYKIESKLAREGVFVPGTEIKIKKIAGDSQAVREGGIVYSTITNHISLDQPLLTQDFRTSRIVEIADHTDTLFIKTESGSVYRLTVAK